MRTTEIPCSPTLTGFVGVSSAQRQNWDDARGKSGKITMPFTRRDFVQTAPIGTVLAAFQEIEPAPAEGASGAGQGTKIVNLDDRVTFRQQLEHNVGPVVLMSTFLVPPDRVDNFLEGFKKQFAIMRKQPGLISAQFHRGIAGSSLFMNYIVWESTDAFRHGYESPEFQAQLKQYPPGIVVSASFFQRVAIPGMCVTEATIAAQ
jgi:heme-degrading monooxygenase HmoA